MIDYNSKSMDCENGDAKFLDWITDKLYAVDAVTETPMHVEVNLDSKSKTGRT